MRGSVERYKAELRKAIWSSGDGIKEEREEMSQYVRKEQMGCNAEETKDISEDIQHFQNQIKKERSIGGKGRSLEECMRDREWCAEVVDFLA